MMHSVLPWVVFAAAFTAGGFLVSYIAFRYGRRLDVMADKWWGIPIAMLIILAVLAVWVVLSLTAGQLAWDATA